MPNPPSNPGFQSLAEYSSPGLILLDAGAETADAVLAKVCELLYRQGRVPDRVSFREAVLARERLSPTSFVKGWALPHARMKDIPELKFAIARASEPVAWFGRASEPVHTIFLFAVPDDGAKDYLSVISGLARLSQNPTLRKRFEASKDEESIFNVLRESPISHASPPRDQRGQVARV